MEEKLNGKSILDENGAGEKVDDYLSDAFPAGLRILIVDDDKEYLTLLENMLKRCQYEGDSIFLMIMLEILIDFFFKAFSSQHSLIFDMANFSYQM